MLLLPGQQLNQQEYYSQCYRQHREPEAPRTRISRKNILSLFFNFRNWFIFFIENLNPSPLVSQIIEKKAASIREKVNYNPLRYYIFTQIFKKKTN